MTGICIADGTRIASPPALECRHCFFGVKLEEGRRVTAISLLQPGPRSGTVRGQLVARGEHWIDVAAANGPQQRYWPRWIGGLPRDGGGLDRDMIRQLGGIAVGSQVELQWRYEERLRVLAIHTPTE